MRNDFLEDNIIIVCTNFMKKKIINYITKNRLIYNIKYMTLSELMDTLTFNIDNKTIYSVMKEFNLSYKNAQMYLSNIKYLGYEEAYDERIKFIEDIKSFCLKNNLLYFNNFLKKKIVGKKVYFVGYKFLSSFEEMILKNNGINYQLISNKETGKSLKAYEFKDMQDEVNFVANEILSLNEKGVSLENIYIANVDEDYDYVIDRVFKMYELPYNKSNNTSLYETEVGLFFLDNLDKGKKEALDLTKDKYPNSLDIINLIVECINNFCFIDNLEDLKTILIDEFKKKQVKKLKYKEGISLTNIDDNIFDKDEYVFLVGCNLNVLPHIFKDEDYLSDKIKFSFLESSKEKNIREKEKKKLEILSIPNITITYKLGYLNTVFYPSTLITELDCTVIKKDMIVSNYSKINNEILMAKCLDDYLKFGLNCSSFSKLLFNYQDIPYNTYDNKFKGIKGFDKDIMLSYSSMDNYYKCAFRYYLASVLKIDIYEESFSQYVGNLFHYVLASVLKEGGNVKLLYAKYLEEHKHNFTEKEKFSLELLEPELEFIVQVIKEQGEYGQFKDLLVEEKIVVEENDLKFKGFIDKILFKDKMAVIIDYKTGDIDINLSLIPYGLSMQLPVYIYLAKKYDKDIKVIGFYLQHILNSKPRRSDNKDYLTLKKEDLRLQGYSIGDTDILEQFDNSYQNSQIIKGMKLGKNGFYSYAKVLTEKEIDNLELMVEKRIKEASEKIKEADFKVNPKIMGNDNLGCKFCKFRDICYKKEEDNVYLKKINDLSFLGGEQDAYMD